ncbi:MAG: hypothetical protein AAGA70_03105 [Pseudomonadota bacterium]
MLSRVFDTEPGKVYRLEFDAAATACAGLLVELCDGATVIGGGAFAVGRPEAVFITVEATGSTTELPFSDVTGARPYDHDIHLDRVSVRPSTDYITNGSFEDGPPGNGHTPEGWTSADTGGRFESNARSTEGLGLYAMDGRGSGQDGVLSKNISRVVPVRRCS